MTNSDFHRSAESSDALGLLAAEDERQSKLHDLLETIREQIRLEIQPENRPDGLFKNIQDAVYAMRGRTRLLDDAAITHALNNAEPLAGLEQRFMQVLDGWEEDSSSPAAVSALQYALGCVRDAMHEVNAIQSRIADGRSDSPSPAIASPVAPSRDEERGHTFDVAQPVAWRYRHRGDPWSVCDTKPEEHVPGMLEVQPLYAAQPPAAPVETKPKASGNINCNRCGGTDPGCYICRDYPHHSSAVTRDDLTANPAWNDGCDFAMTQLCIFLGVKQDDVRWDAATETVDGDVQAVIGNILRAKFGEDWGPDDTTNEPQAAPVIVGYQRRNIGPDGTPWSSWYPANDEPTPENMKFDGYLSYEYRPVHAGSPLPRPHGGRDL